VNIKDFAYQKYSEAWDATAKYVGPYTHAAYESLHSAWEHAWQAHEEAVHKVWEYGQSSIDAAVKEYEYAKENLITSTENLKNWLNENKQILKEKASETHAETLSKLHTAETQAHEKYLAAKDQLFKIYDSTYEEAVKDYIVTKDKLEHARQKLGEFTNDASAKASENYEATKKKFIETQEKANQQYEASKTKLQEFGQTLTSWKDTAQKTAYQNAEYSKQRASEILSHLNEIREQAKDKASQTLVQKHQEIYDASCKYAEEAHKKSLEAKASFDEFVQRTKDWWSQEEKPTMAPVSTEAVDTSKTERI
jgi:hypothetical protein